MTETPLQILESAVQEFLRATAVDGELHGFVLLATTSQLDAEVSSDLVPLGWSNHYATTAAPTEALGISQAFVRLMEDVVSFDDEPGGDVS